MNLRVWFLITMMILSFSAGCTSSGTMTHQQVLSQVEVRQLLGAGMSIGYSVAP
jgi:hypothetical protein